MSQPKNVVIVGGVAGGASCATRLRRLDESASITVLERGDYVSFANCGLPYYVGGVIPERASLLQATPELFRNRFRLDVRTGHEVTRLDPAAREVHGHDASTGAAFVLPYDALVLSPGAAPLRPPIPGINLPGVFEVRTIPDSDQIRRWIEDRKATSAVVVGGGFIGVEMAENLIHRGLATTLVEMLPQVMPPLDPEMALSVRERMEAHGVRMALGDAVAGLESATDGSLVVTTRSGARHSGDLVIVALGVRPETKLAREAGLAIGPTGGIQVDDHMRTSDPHIYAVGDAAEVKDFLTGQPRLLALAGPANRQGRVAADNIAGRPSTFRAVQGTSIVGVFGLAAACTGASEAALRRAGREDFAAVHLYPADHARYYPGASTLHLKLIFRRGDGLILGAQAVGEAGVARRIDVIAMAMQKGGTVHDLAEAELCYAPQFGGAKDPVNFAGMIAGNVLNGDMPLASPAEAGSPAAFLLDVRDPDEFAAGALEGAVSIPLGELRRRWHELPRDRPIDVYCQVGQRGYYATRILRQLGLDARNITGGVTAVRTLLAARATTHPPSQP